MLVQWQCLESSIENDYESSLGFMGKRVMGTWNYPQDWEGLYKKKDVYVADPIKQDTPGPHPRPWPHVAERPFV